MVVSHPGHFVHSCLRRLQDIQDPVRISKYSPQAKTYFSLFPIDSPAHWQLHPIHHGWTACLFAIHQTSVRLHTQVRIFCQFH